MLCVAPLHLYQASSAVTQTWGPCCLPPAASFKSKQDLACVLIPRSVLSSSSAFPRPPHLEDLQKCYLFSATQIFTALIFFFPFVTFSYLSSNSWLPVTDFLFSLEYMGTLKVDRWATLLTPMFL